MTVQSKVESIVLPNHAISNIPFPSDRANAVQRLLLKTADYFLKNRELSANALFRARTCVFMQTVIESINFAIYTYLFLHSKKIAGIELAEWIEDEMEAAKLQEISFFAQSILPNYLPLLKQFNTEISTLNKDPSQLDEGGLDRLNATSVELNAVSQTMGWIYRAYRNEMVVSVPSSAFYAQLELLLESKMHGSGERQLEVRKSSEPFALAGPIPSLMLLSIALLERICLFICVSNRPSSAYPRALGFRVHSLHCVD
ncbi:MAG: hypothetical protein H7249_05665 [Chitinophagaceae bacterium]|nr:hypothetical protein [Oligoflexus sp.]